MTLDTFHQQIKFQIDLSLITGFIVINNQFSRIANFFTPVAPNGWQLPEGWDFYHKK